MTGRSAAPGVSDHILIMYIHPRYAWMQPQHGAAFPRGDPTRVAYATVRPGSRRCIYQCIVVYSELIVNNGLVRKKLLNGERNFAVPPCTRPPRQAVLRLGEKTLWLDALRRCSLPADKRFIITIKSVWYVYHIATGSSRKDSRRTQPPLHIIISRLRQNLSFCTPTATVFAIRTLIRRRRTFIRTHNFIGNNRTHEVSMQICSVTAGF